ncbi:hypothetical protein V492_04420 [Pseudogymnoascus sp. VKM F-4246]|nr:hypothetical protein V492_04420 [Pseudogymnoascus sp. VKM F-4246]
MPAYDWKTTTFAEATAIKAIDSHTYEGSFPDDWSIGKVPNGGIVCGNFLAVAKLHFETTLKAQNQPHTIAFHTDFLRRTQEGPCRFKVTDTKLGRQTSVIHISMSQGREEVVAYLTQSNLITEEGLSLDTGFELHPKPPPVDLVKLKEDKDEHWERRAEMPFASFRKAVTKLQFHFPRNGQPHRSIGDEWVHLNTGEKITNQSLGFIADMFPMPVESFREREDPYDSKDPEKAKKRLAIYWYPTVLLNIEFKKLLPEEGVEWLFSRCKTKQIKNGRMDLELTIMDAEGDIVALSHHVCLVLPAERNIAPRREDGSKI